MDELPQPQLKIQSQSIDQAEVRAFSPAQQKILDQIVLSPLEKYSKHNRFPWQILLTAIMILCATLTVQSTVQSNFPQKRQVQIFFNFHLLQHDSYDIYEGSTVFTWQTHQYRNFQEMYDFFSRVLDTLQSINSLNFYPVDEEIFNKKTHTIKRIYRDGTINITDYTLPELVQSDYLTVGLKDYLRNVNMMKMELDVPQISSGLQKVLLVLDIQIKQKFMMFVQVKTECVTNSTNQETHNLKIRKLPGKHKKLGAPPNMNAVAATLLFLLTLHSMFLRYDAYKQHPMFIDGVSNGKPFSQMSFLEKLSLLGPWNIVMLLLCLGTFLGDGLAVFLCWIQLIRYLEYTKNPFLISFLLRKVLPIQAALLLNVMIVLSGYVMFSMVVFVETKKFQSVKFAYFNYLFNNFQYGIYENFIALGPYGGFYQMLYYALLFFMVSCANQMLPSFLVNYVLSRSRYQGLQQLIRNLQIPCPLCKRITNTSPKKRGGTQSQSDVDDSEVKIAVTSPKFSPFLTPSTVPFQPGRKLVQQKPMKKRTLFKIQEDIEVPKNNARFALIISKSELLMSRFEQCILNLQINKEPQYAKHLSKWLRVSLVKTASLSTRVERLSMRYTQHAEAGINTP